MRRYEKLIFDSKSKLSRIWDDPNEEVKKPHVSFRLYENEEVFCVLHPHERQISRVRDMINRWINYEENEGIKMYDMMWFYT